MKILKIENWDDNKIIVTVENYPHAQPTFPNTITKAELEIAIKNWKVNQDAVDLINNQPPIIVPVVDISDLKTLEGKDIK